MWQLLLALIFCSVVPGCSKKPYPLANLGGYSLEYQVLGTSDTCVALFEAGMSFDLETFDPIFKKLSKNCTAIRYSRIGQGQSSQLSTKLSTEN